MSRKFRGIIGTLFLLQGRFGAGPFICNSMMKDILKSPSCANIDDFTEAAGQGLYAERPRLHLRTVAILPRNKTLAALLSAKFDDGR